MNDYSNPKKKVDDFIHRLFPAQKQPSKRATTRQTAIAVDPVYAAAEVMYLADR